MSQSALATAPPGKLIAYLIGAGNLYKPFSKTQNLPNLMYQLQMVCLSHYNLRNSHQIFVMFKWCVLKYKLSKILKKKDLQKMF
jgi:hypothetical protein